MSFSAFLIYYQKSQQITNSQETGRCHSDRAHWPRMALATTAQHPVQGGPHPSDGNGPARRGWTRPSRQSRCQGSCLLAALTSDVPAAGKSSITSNATTSGSNSVVLAEGRLAYPLLPPHSYMETSISQLHQFITFSRSAGTNLVALYVAGRPQGVHQHLITEGRLKYLKSPTQRLLSRVGLCSHKHS